MRDLSISLKKIYQVCMHTNTHTGTHTNTHMYTDIHTHKMCNIIGNQQITNQSYI